MICSVMLLVRLWLQGCLATCIVALTARWAALTLQTPLMFRRTVVTCLRFRLALTSPPGSLLRTGKFLPFGFLFCLNRTNIRPYILRQCLLLIIGLFLWLQLGLWLQQTLSYGLYGLGIFTD